jgi:guanine deaminase
MGAFTPVADTHGVRAHRGTILHFRGDPGGSDDPTSFELFEDGLLVVADGRVAALGPARDLLSGLPCELEIVEHAGSLLLPGFVDIHIHYPQTDVIASLGGDLLAWLEQYIFPQETRFADPVHARAVAEVFLDELLRHGTTTAAVYCTVHPASVEAFFEAAAARSLRMAAGKVLMDRNCPANLRDTPEDGERDTRRLLAKWHGRGRLAYAITPRFAGTSSEAQLAGAGRLAQEFPQALVQTHLAESVEEVAWVRRLFPEARSYYDVYERFGLARERAVFAHCIHVDETDRVCMARAGATASFCPSSNLFLGSGLFDIAATDAAGLRFAMGSDVGGGSSFSMLRTLAAAYEVAQLKRQPLSPLRAFYLATRGGARALGFDQVGHLSVGAEADFIVLDPAATPLLARRWEMTRSLKERLLLLMMLGDERTVAGTYVLGRRVGAVD